MALPLVDAARKLRGSRAGAALTLARLEADRALPRPGAVRALEPVFARLRAVMADEQPPLSALCELAHACLAAAADGKQAQPAAAKALPKDANAAPGPVHPRAALAVEWLRQHCTQGATVEDAAQALGLSRSGLFRLLRTHTGQNPKTYLDHLRVEHAKHLLRHGGYAMKEVAARCGFADARHFTRAFARKTGLPPAAWATQAK